MRFSTKTRIYVNILPIVRRPEAQAATWRTREIHHRHAWTPVPLENPSQCRVSCPVNPGIAAVWLRSHSPPGDDTATDEFARGTSCHPDDCPIVAYSGTEQHSVAARSSLVYLSHTDIWPASAAAHLRNYADVGPGRGVAE